MSTRGTDGKGDADRVTSASEPLSGEGEGRRRRQNDCVVRGRARGSYDERYMPTGRVKETAVFEDLFVGVEDSSSGKATVEMQNPNFEAAMGQSWTLSAWTATSGSDSVNLGTEEKHLSMDTTRRLRTNEWGAGVEDGGGYVSEGKGNGSKVVEARANDPGSNQKRGIGLAGLDQELTLAAERGQRTVTPGLIGSRLEGLVLGCHRSNLTRAGIKGSADIFSRKEVVYKEKLGTYDRNNMEKGKW
ncbi:hypothetical protein EDB85DRAFT_2197930 [Lactarius pseudohatsudake]|nr:hypothetical protein EDB85DRAFT_2197930 [Lactarius pseudohatsudake]